MGFKLIFGGISNFLRGKYFSWLYIFSEIKYFIGCFCSCYKSFVCALEEKREGDRRLWIVPILMKGLEPGDKKVWVGFGRGFNWKLEGRNNDVVLRIYIRVGFGAEYIDDRFLFKGGRSFLEYDIN